MPRRKVAGGAATSAPRPDAAPPHIAPAARQQVYAQFREHTAEVLERLLEVLRDPDADAGHVIAAGKVILERGWGAVPQHQVIEGVMHHQHVVHTDALRQLSAGQLAELESALTRLVQPSGGTMIDVTPRKTPQGGL